MTASRLDRFAADLETAIAVVEEELAALERRDLSRLEQSGARKAALAETLEMQAADLGPSLAGPEAAPLRARISYFRALLERNRALLDRLTTAAGSMLREIARVRDRHGLGGLYGKSGKRRTVAVKAQPPLDQNI